MPTLPAVALLATALASAAPPPPRGIVAIVRSRVVRVFRTMPAPPALVERKGPRCVPAAAVAGAEVTSPTGIDLVLRGGERVRARLDDDCPALDFYRGFYVSPKPDGRICADRDAIRTRSGGECGIERFRRLVPSTP